MWITVVWQIFNLILQIAVVIGVCFAVRALIHIVGDYYLDKKYGKHDKQKLQNNKDEPDR